MHMRTCMLTHRQLCIQLVHPRLKVSIQLGRRRHARLFNIQDAAQAGEQGNAGAGQGQGQGRVG